MSRAQLEKVAARAARKYGVPVKLFKAQITQESGWNPNAVSPAGAIGVAQIVPKWHPGVNPKDPVASLNYAARLMSNHFKKYGSWRDALSAYNSGRPWSEGKGISETNNYVKSILGATGNVGGLKPVSTGKPGDFSAAELGMPDTEGAVLGGLQDLTAGQWDPLKQLNDLVMSMRMPSGGAVSPSKAQAGVGAGATSPARAKAILGGHKWNDLGGPSAHGARAMGNWQSDNAVDVGAPAGTPVYAVRGGVITGGFGESSGGGGKVYGKRLTIKGGGNQFFYTHLGAYAKGIKPGARIRKGQLIGYIGKGGPGMPTHVHFAVMNGNPYRYLRRRRGR